jgi:hypothetical protein
MEEIAHKQRMLSLSIELGATHVFWLDCDEVLERRGTEGGIRRLCENWPGNQLDAYFFRELNLWRSERWVRTDSLFDKGRFRRLWKITDNIHFNVVEGVHKQLYPITVRNIQEAPFGVIHYGFHDYLKMMVKIGAHQFTKEQLVENARDNWILDERECSCYYLPDECYPLGCVPVGEWDQPQPRTLGELQTYNELLGEL